jgi:hypothetical protein
VLKLTGGEARRRSTSTSAGWPTPERRAAGRQVPRVRRALLRPGPGRSATSAAGSTLSTTSVASGTPASPDAEPSLAVRRSARPPTARSSF